MSNSSKNHKPDKKTTLENMKKTPTTTENTTENKNTDTLENRPKDQPKDQPHHLQNHQPKPKSIGKNTKTFKDLLPLDYLSKYGLLTLSILAIVLLVSLMVNFLSLRQIQTLATQNQDNSLLLSNLSKRMGLTEGEIQDLNKPTISPNELIQKALRSVVIIEKKIEASDVENLKNFVRDTYLTRIEDKDVLNRASPAKELWEPLGSGVVLSKNGYIVTNKHIVASNGLYRIRTFDDNQIYPIQRAMIHPYEDIAIVEAIDQNSSNPNDSDLGLTPIEIETQTPETGDEIYALGHPAKLSFSVTKGTVSNPNRNFSASIDDYLADLKLPEILRRAYFDNSGQASLLPVFLNSDYSQASLLQHSASINLGSSGGAIINNQGKLVGINTFGIQKDDNVTYNIVPNLENPYQPIEQLSDIQDKIFQGYTPGSDFNLNGAIKAEVVSQIWNQFQECKKNNTPFTVPYLGIYVNNFTQTQSSLMGYPVSYGFQVSRPADKVYNYDLSAIDPNGPAKDLDLKEGDILASVDGVEITENNDIGKILSTKKPNDSIKLGFYRQGIDKIWTKSEVDITLGSLPAWDEVSIQNLTLGDIKM